MRTNMAYTSRIVDVYGTMMVEVVGVMMSQFHCWTIGQASDRGVGMDDRHLEYEYHHQHYHRYKCYIHHTILTPTE